MKLLLESEVRKLLRHELKPEKYNDISDKIKGLKHVEAIPFNYINTYAALKHDAAFQTEMLEMVNKYRHSLNRGGDNENGDSK